MQERHRLATARGQGEVVNIAEDAGLHGPVHVLVALFARIPIQPDIAYPWRKRPAQLALAATRIQQHLAGTYAGHQPSRKLAPGTVATALQIAPSETVAQGSQPADGHGFKSRVIAEQRLAVPPSGAKTAR